MDWTILGPKVWKVIPAQPCIRSKRLIALCSGEVFPGCARLCPRLPRQGGFVLWILNGLRESFYKMRQQYKQDDQQAGKLDEAWKEQYAHCTRSQRSHWSFKTLSVFAAVVISQYDYSHSRWSQKFKRIIGDFVVCPFILFYVEFPCLKCKATKGDLWSLRKSLCCFYWVGGWGREESVWI